MPIIDPKLGEDKQDEGPEPLLQSFGKLTKEEQQALQVMKDARDEHIAWHKRMDAEKEAGDLERRKLFHERHEMFWKGVAERVGFNRDDMAVSIVDDFELVESRQQEQEKVFGEAFTALFKHLSEGQHKKH